MRATTSRVFPLRLRGQAESQGSIARRHGGQHVAGIESIEKTALPRDVFPRDILDRPTRVRVYGRIGAHDSLPQGLSHRHDADEEACQIHRSPPVPMAESIRGTRGPRYPRQHERVRPRRPGPGKPAWFHESGSLPRPGLARDPEGAGHLMAAGLTVRPNDVQR